MPLADEFKLDLDKILIEQRGGWAGGTLDWTGSFLRSAVEAIPELIGITPSQETLRFRANNPVGGFTSELAGMVVPYAGWGRVARGIKPLEAIATGVGRAQVGTEAGAASYAARLADAPFRTAAKAEAIRFAPAEAFRNVANAAVGDQSFSEMAFSSAINSALGAGVMGGLAKMGASGKGVSRFGLDEGMHPQLLLRKVDELLPTASPEAQVSLREATEELERRALTETAPKGYLYVDPKVDTKDGYLNRLFVPGKDKGGYLDRKVLASGTANENFPTPEAWQGVLRDNGIEPAVAARFMQYPRVLQINAAPEMATGVDDFTNTLARATKVEETIKKQLRPVGEGWWMAKEPDDGMFLVAKKIAGEDGKGVPGRVYYQGKLNGKWTKAVDLPEQLPSGTINIVRKETKAQISSKPGTEDQWLMFKTDTPGQFMKESQAFMNAQVARERWIVGRPAMEELAEAPGLIGNLLRVPKRFPAQDALDYAALHKGEPVAMAKKFEEWTPKALKGNALMQGGKAIIREYLLPAADQFRKHTLGRWVHGVAKIMHDASDTWFEQLFRGEGRLAKDNLFWNQLVPKEGERAMVHVLQEIGDKGLIDDVMRVWREGIPEQGLAQFAAEGKISPRAAELATELQGFVRRAAEVVNQSEAAAGKTLTKFRDDDYGIPRILDGDYFKIVREEGGRIAALGSGGSPKAAAQRAGKIAEEYSKRTGVRHFVGEDFVRGQDPKGLPKGVTARMVETPGLKIGNRNIGGHRWDVETPTLEDLQNAIWNRLEGYSRTVASNVRDASLMRYLDAVDDPQTRRILQTRFNQLSGIASDWDKAQNKFVDKFLGRFLGANSATKLVQVVNTGMHHLQLGFGKLSYPIQNVLSPIQTVAAELAFVLNAPEGHRALAFGVTAPLVGARGAVGSVTFLHPWKMLGEGLSMMMRPSADEKAFIQWAMSERLLGAKVGEEFIGQNRRSLSNWKGAINSPKALGEFVLDLSSWPMIHSEQFARTWTAAAAYRTMKGAMGVVDEDVLRLSVKRIIERTNYLYSGADRPLAFSTPLGSSLGLFKTWQMNYISRMAEYANLGLERGVWSPLVWQTMGTAALAGAAGSPLYLAAQAASNLFENKDLMQYAYGEWNSKTADGVLFGLPAALTGVSLSSLMSSPGANPVKDATQLFSFAIWQRAREVGGTIGSAIDHWQATGQHPASDPDVRNKLVKAFAPVLLQRYMQMNEDEIRSLSTGLPTAKNVGLYDRIMFQMGMQPVMLEREMKVSEELYKSKEKMKAAVAAYGDALAEAFTSNNSQAADLIMQRMTAQGIDISRGLQSAMTRMRNERSATVDRLAKPADVMAWEMVRNAGR